MPNILNVIPNDNHTLEIELDNKHKIIYDMKPRLKTVRFSQLSDLISFKNLKVENGNTIVWNSFCEITITEIISLVER